MKSLFKILNLVLCLELIVGPMMASGGHGLFISSAYAEDCPAGTSMDTTLNRCLTSEQTAEIMNAVANCNGDKACYKSNAENALKEAEEEGKIKTALANKSGLMNTSMKAAAVAVPLTMAVVMMKEMKKGGAVKCAAPSIYAMLGGGVAMFAGDTIANMQHKSRLKKIKKEWDEILKGNEPSSSTTSNSTSTSSTTSTATDAPGDKVKATEGQSQAFEMLARSEESMEKAAKLKTVTYGIATAAFGAAAVLSTIEAIKPPTGDTICKVKDTPPTQQAPEDFSDVPQDNSIPAKPPKLIRNFNNFYLEYEAVRISTVFPSRIQWENLKNAQSFDTLFTLRNEMYLNSTSSSSLNEHQYYKDLFEGVQIDETIFKYVKIVTMEVFSGIGVSSAHADSPVTKVAADNVGKVKGLSRFLLKPVTRAIISGVFTAWAAIMTMHSMKQAKVSKNRAEFLRKMKDEFNDASGAINSCSAADRGNPAKPNCYCYTDAGSRNADRTNSSVCTALFTGKSASTTAGNYLLNTATETLGCVTSAGATDSTCSCRNTNTCLKATSAGLGSLNPGTFSMLSSPLTAVDKFGNGTLDAASVNGSASVSNAARLLDAANKLAGNNKAGQEILKNKKNVAADLTKGLTTAGSGLSGSNTLGSGSSGFGSMSPSQAAAALEEELKGVDQSGINEVKGDAIAAPGSDKPDDQLEFGMSATDLAAQEGQLSQVMGQNLDYGTNDINNASSTTLFEVLSNRYQRSGMRRLFDEEGKTKPEPSSKSDINQ